MARGLQGFGKYHNGTKIDGKPLRKHVINAQKALGKPLPSGAVVHHIDGNRANNENKNLLICPSEAYHNLIHLRTEALEACGNASWRRCVHCKEWHPIETMTKRDKRPNTSYQHKHCHTEYENRRRNGLL